MRWLLITNYGNVGDEAVRVGIEKIIRTVDPEPQFIMVSRDHSEKQTTHGEIPIAKAFPDFDYAVVCGMPLVWSHEKGNTCQHGAWGPLSKLAETGKLIVAGFGLYLMINKTGQIQIKDDSIFPKIKSFFDQCLLVYSRSPLAERYFPGCKFAPCPSIFAGMDFPETVRNLRLFNSMEGGGAHYPWLEPEQAARWKEKVRGIACVFRDQGFKFIAHLEKEADFACSELGWRRSNCIVFDGDTDAFLRIYSRCSQYFGNRIHGAIMARSFGASATCVGYDTRLQAVQLVGGTTYTPHTMPGITELTRSVRAARPSDPRDLRAWKAAEFRRQCEWFKAVLDGKRA